MDWKIVEVQKTEWIQDGSGVYTLINYAGLDRVRIDIMTTKDEPIISFIGRADDVRKAIMRYCNNYGIMLSLEHAAYIGAELARAELLKINYAQD